MLKKSYIGWILLLAFFIGIPYLTGVLSRNKSSSAPHAVETIIDQRFETMGEDEEYTLLAAKYGLPIMTVRGLLEDYMEVLVPQRDEAIFPQAKDTEGVLKAMSEKYGVPTTTIASLVIDWKAMREASNE